MKTILLCIGVILSFCGETQNTLIPDSNFEQTLIDYGYDNTLDGYVSTASIDTVTELYVSNKAISDLSGVEDFVMLKKLWCDQNELITLDISQNFVLENLVCSSNFLTTIDLSQNVNLQYLNCDMNELTALDLSQNTALTLIFCESNNLSSIDVLQCTNLINLDCGANLLTTLNVTQNNSLRWLNCGTNKLTVLDLTHSDSLEYLVCHVNPLGSLDVSNNSLLRHLDCDFNELTSLNITQNPNLELLYCMDNQLSELNVSENVHLDRLACYNNNLYCLNLKNGNNDQMEYFGTFNNPNLTCIEVDDPIWSTTYWLSANGQINDQMSFSNHCGNNCTTSLVELSTMSKELIKIIDCLGREVNYQPNTPLIYLYSDGTSKRVFEVSP